MSEDPSVPHSSQKKRKRLPVSRLDEKPWKSSPTLPPWTHMAMGNKLLSPLLLSYSIAEDMTNSLLLPSLSPVLLWKSYGHGHSAVRKASYRWWVSLIREAPQVNLICIKGLQRELGENFRGLVFSLPIWFIAKEVTNTTQITILSWRENAMMLWDAVATLYYTWPYALSALPVNL